MDLQDAVTDPIWKQNELESKRLCQKVFDEVFYQHVSTKAAETAAKNAIVCLWDGLTTALESYKSRSCGPMKEEVWNMLSMQKMRPLCVDAYTTCCQLAQQTAKKLEESQGRCTAADAALRQERATRLDLEGEINQHVFDLGARDTEIMRLQGQLQTHEHTITRDKRRAESDQRALEQVKIDLNRCATERSRKAEQLAEARREILATKATRQAFMSKFSSLQRAVFDVKQRVKTVRIQAVSKQTEFSNWLRNSKQNICSSVGEQLEAVQIEVNNAMETRRVKNLETKNGLENVAREVLRLRSNLVQIRHLMLNNVEVSRKSLNHVFGSCSSKISAVATQWSKAKSDTDAACQVRGLSYK